MIEEDRGIIIVVVGIVSLIFVAGNYETIHSLGSGFFPSIPHKFVDGEYRTICNEMCFDLMKNSATKGYDPNFLKTPKVKQTCIDAGTYSKQMGFCLMIK